MSTKPVRSYRDAIDSFRKTKDYTGSYNLNEIRSGRKLTDKNGGDSKKLSEDVTSSEKKD